MKANISHLTYQEKKVLYKAAFDLFISKDYDSKRQKYVIGGYEIDRNQLYQWKNAYIRCATPKEASTFTENVHNRQTDKLKTTQQKIIDRGKQALAVYIEGIDVTLNLTLLAENNGVSITTIKQSMREYCEKYGTEEEQKIYRAIAQRAMDRKTKPKYLSDDQYFAIFETVLTLETVLERCQYISDNLQNRQLSILLNDFALKYPKRTEDLHRLKIIAKEYQKQNRRNRKQKIKNNIPTVPAIYLQLANQITTEFVTGPYPDLPTFCEKRNIPLSDVHQYLNLAEVYNPELYQSYINKMETINSERNKQIKHVLAVIAHYAKEGIKEGDTTRKFDLLDYYLLTNGIFDNKGAPEEKSNFSELAGYAGLPQFCNPNQKREIDHFIERNRRNTIPLNEPEILTGKHIINNIEVPLEMKQESIQFLKDNNLPELQVLYSLVVRRKTKQQLLFINPEKPKVKNLKKEAI